jgi:hypothetical protein
MAYKKSSIEKVSAPQSKTVEVDNSDGFILVSEWDTESITANKFSDCNGLIIENVGKVGAEIQLTISKWTEGTPDAHTDNTTYVDMLLGAGKKIELPHNRMLFYSTANSSANGYTYNDDGAYEGYYTASCLLAEAIDTTEVDWTVDDTDWFCVGDYIVVDPTATTMEIVKVTSITNSTVLVVERGMLGTEGVAHSDNAQIYFYYGNHYENCAVYGATSISFDETTADAIDDSASNFLTKGFQPFYPVAVTGSTSNNASYFPSKVVAGKITLHLKGAQALTDESAGDSVVMIQIPASICDEKGRYASSNFFGYGRNGGSQPAGIVKGSVAFKYYSKSYAKFGFKNLTTNFDTKLSASTAYAFGLTVDGLNVDVAFTTDATDLTIGGVNGIIRKMQTAIDDLVEAETIPVGAVVGMRDGDLCITSRTGIGQAMGLIALDTSKGSDIIIGAPASGTTVLGAGRFPSKTITYKSALPTDTKVNLNRREVKNEEEMILDDGNGGLYMNGVQHGTIEYASGAFTLYNLPAYSEIIGYASYSSALSGTLETNASFNSGVYKVSARSCNPRANAKIKLTNVE